LTLRRITLLLCSMLMISLASSSTMTSRIAMAVCINDCWKIVTSVDPSSDLDILYGVAAISQNDVWAVGTLETLSGNGSLAEHWDGSNWSNSAVTKIGASDELHAVAAVASNDVWAVGYTISTSTAALIEHWNGTQWSQVTSPTPSNSTGNRLYSVAVVSSNNVWAVGYFTDATTGKHKTLIEQWNGTQWNIVASSNPGTNDNELYGVSVAASNDIWAVGRYYTGSTTTQTLIEHWNGTSWSTTTSPNPGTSNNDLYGVAVASSTNVWAVGSYKNTSGSSQTLTQKWNGTSWSTISSPNPTATNSNYLNGVSPISTSYVWAVGYYDKSPFQTATMKWNGTSWTIVSSPNQGANANFLFAVSVRPGTSVATGGEIWAVGKYFDGTNDKTLVLEYIISAGARNP